MASKHPVLKNFRRCLFCLWIGIIGSLNGACAENVGALTALEQEWLAAHSPIRIAPDPHFVPIEFFDDSGQYQGIAADYVALLEEKLGIRFEIVRLANWEAVLTAMKNRKVDVLNAVVQTPQRSEYMLFPPPYLEIPSVIIVRKHVRRPLNLELLEGMTVAMVAGYGYVDVIRNTYPEIRLALLPDIKTALRKVSFGMVDAFIGDLATTSYYIEEEGITNLRIAGETAPPNISGFGVRSDWPELTGILTKGIAMMTEEEKKSILRKWISLENSSGWTVQELRNLIVIGLGIVGVTFSAIMLWNRSLKRMVQKRTKELQQELLERKRIEYALRESKERLQLTLEGANNGLWDFYPQAGKIYYSDRWFAMLGYDPDEFSQTLATWRTLLHPEDKAKAEKRLQQFLETREEYYTSEFRMRAKHGGWRWILSRGKAVEWDTQGNITRLVGIHIDITTFKEAEAERLIHIQFLENMERIERTIHQTTDVEQMLQKVIQTVFAIFECDRVWLLFPCDPDAPFFQVPVEYTRPEFPGAYALRQEIPMRQGTDEHCRMALNSFEPVILGHDPDEHLSGGNVEYFAVQSQMFIALRPKIGKPWLFGLHQCSYVRVWSQEEQRLFQEISGRITEALSTLLFLRDLKKSEERFKGLVANIPGVVFRCQLHPLWTMRFMSDAMETLFGYPASDFLYNAKRVFASIIHSEDRDMVADMIRAASEHGEPYSVEYRIIDKEGTLHWVHEKGRTLRNHEHEEWLDGVIFDISERMQAEHELRRLRNLLSNIINSMPSVLIGVDLEGRIMQWNREAEYTTGVLAEEAQGQTLSHVFPQLAGEVEKIYLAIRHRQPQKREKVILEQQQGSCYADITVYPLLANGIEGAVIRIDDVTERVRIEDMMIQSEKMMTVGSLAAGMAHEINNPLGIILQSVQNMQRRLSPDLRSNQDIAETCGADLDVIRAYLQQRNIFQYIKGIQDAGLRASNIVLNMLHFSRRSESRLIPVDFHQLIENTLELAQNDYDLRKNYDFRHIRILKDYDPTLKQIPCRPSEIEQVLLNLLKNAAHAVSEKQAADHLPQITIRTRKRDQYAVLSIADNGPGLDEDVRKRIFEPFFTTKPVGRGTGLGLSVSYFIITNNHNGTITTESKMGEGTRFTITLPLRS